MSLRRQDIGGATDMTKGNAGKLILKFSLPLVFGNLFQQLYSITDAAVLGRYVGVDALASVGCVSWVCWLINAFLRDWANAFSISASVCMGKGEEEEFRLIAANAVTICMVVGIPAAAALLWMMPWILGLLSVQPNVIHMTRQYLTVYSLTIPIGMAHSIGAGLLRAYGNSRVTFVSMTVSNMVNIVLDLIFVLVFGWGVLGAAAATWIAQFMAMAVALASAVRVPAFHIKKEELRLDSRFMGELLRLWSPMIFNSMVIAAGGLFVEKHTNQMGSWFTAGLAACGKIFGLLEAVIMAIQTGVSVYVGQNLGAEQFKRIRDGLAESVKLGLGVTIAMVLAVLALRHGIIPLFLSPEDPTAYQQAFRTADMDTCIVLASMVIMTPMYLYRVTIQTLGFPKYAAAAGVLQLAARIAAVTAGAALLGEYAYFLTETMAWLVSLPVVAIPCVRYLKRRMEEGEPKKT